MLVTASSPATRARALSAGIAVAFHDIDGEERHASEESLRAGLAAIESGSGYREADPAIPPVILSRDGQATKLAIRGEIAAPTLDCRLVDEAGLETAWAAPVVDGQLALPPLPFGYHNLSIELGGRLVTSRVISAPARAHQPGGARTWGVFTPLYALRSGGNAGAGDLLDLVDFGELMGREGASFVGTLPLLASFLDDPFEPSPYAPVSRTCWNEFYARPEGLPPAGPEGLRGEALVDYRSVAARKREAIETQLRAPGAPWPQIEAYAACHPHVERYARFRAFQRRSRTNWQAWPEPQRSGTIDMEAIDRDEYRYHLFAQWLTATQIDAAAVHLRDHGVGLYLDYPVGVHPDGFDAWDGQGLFAEGMNVGAPPDGFQRAGQDWGFRPMLPAALREQGYRPLINALRHHMAVASMLRIDHVMGLHRLYWVPHGMGAKEGIYVNYPAEELYAVLCLESYHHGVPIVGEDLGTVPPEVRESMEAHGLQRMYVAQTELRIGRTSPLPTPEKSSVASLNTHDMPPFAAYWEQSSADRRESFASAVGAPLDGEPAVIANHAHRWLAGSPARTVMVTLEDVWGETRPQNLPGTSGEAPNWRGRHRYSLEQLPALPELRQLSQSMSSRGGKS